MSAVLAHGAPRRCGLRRRPMFASSRNSGLSLGLKAAPQMIPAEPIGHAKLIEAVNDLGYGTDTSASDRASAQRRTTRIARGTGPQSTAPRTCQTWGIRLPVARLLVIVEYPLSIRIPTIVACQFLDGSGRRSFQLILRRRASATPSHVKRS